MHDYPTRNFITSFEYRFQESERRIENMHRIGTVPKDGVKYDQEKKRWYVKLSQEDGFVTTWIPWETMSSSWMKVSSPPAEGQSIQMHTQAGGDAGQSVCRPYHNNDDTPSPSEKPGEFHMRIEKPGQDGKPGSDPDKILNFGYTPDGATVQIGKTTHNLNKDTQTVTTENNNVTTKNDTKNVSDTHTLNTNKRVIKAQESTVQAAKYSVTGKVLINC